MTHEDHITEHLVQSLIRTKKVPGRIVYQYTLLVEDVAGDVSMSSNIDFVLTVGDDEDVYLACECKRLNVPYKTGVRGLVGEYVDEGLMRFVSGQYANGLPLAMMLGYVMNARTEHARRGLRRAMSIRSAAIRLQMERDAPVEVGYPLRFNTTHACSQHHTIEVMHTPYDESISPSGMPHPVWCRGPPRQLYPCLARTSLAPWLSAIALP